MCPRSGSPVSRGREAAARPAASGRLAASQTTMSEYGAGLRLDRLPRPATASRIRCEARDSAETRRSTSPARGGRGRRGLDQRDPQFADMRSSRASERGEARTDDAATDDRRCRNRRPRTCSLSGLAASGTPRASRGMRPAAPTLSRASAFFAGGSASKASRPRPRRLRTTPSGVPNRRTSPSVNATMRRRSSSRHAAYAIEDRFAAGSVPPAASASASTSARLAASRRPRLNPWPAIGCRPCAALPTIASRGAVCRSARVSASS